MNVHDYLKLLRKRWLTIVLVALLGIGAAAAFVLTSTKVYTASAQIFVAASSADNTAALNNGNTFAQARVQSYTSVANGPDVTKAVAKAVPDLHLTPAAIAGKISADAPLNKVLLNVHVDDTSPVVAARLANVLASKLVTYIEQIEKISAGSAESPVKLTVIHPASIPSAPTSPKTTLDLAIGLIAGLLLGLGLAVLRETIDTRVRTGHEATEVSGAALLAAVPSDKRTNANPVATRADEYSARAEAYRQLRANLQYIAVDEPPKVIAVSSAVAGEGKTITAINLATTMADAGLKVFLIDADLRRPMIGEYLGLPSGAGLTSILAGKAPVADVLQPVGSNLAVITSGPIPPNPSELLGSRQFKSLVRDLADGVDYVVVDTAPLLPVADGREVATASDISLLVTHAGRVNREQLKQAVAALQRVGAKLGGLVFNHVSAREAGNYYRYYGAEKRSARRVAVKG